LESTTSTRSTTAYGAIAIAVLAALFAIFALGVSLSTRNNAPSVGPGPGGGDAPSGPVAISLTEFAITPAAITVPADGSLAVSNDGAAPHNLTVRDADYATSDLNGGDSETLSLAGLAPGSYTVFCSIPGHEAAGMAGTLTVGAEGGEGTAAPGAPAPIGAEMLHANYLASVSKFPAETAAMGNQLMEPIIEADGTKVFELTIDETEWEVEPGVFVQATAYNGQVPGPLIKVDVGDRVKIILHNALEDEPTTLHPHGVFMHPFEADGVGHISMDPIMPGESWEETWVMEEPSVGMYHGHDNGVHQVPNGAFGAWIVGEMPLPPEADNVVQEHVMVLNDAGNIGLTLNGKSFPATQPYGLELGQQMVLHYYNEGFSPHPMHLHNNKQLVIAKDGYPLEVPYAVDTLNVAPGERYTVVVFAENLGTWVFHCHILTHVEKTDGSVFGMFTALAVTEPEGGAATEAPTEEGTETPTATETPTG
jgi:manganese oxidase